MTLKENRRNIYCKFLLLAANASLMAIFVSLVFYFLWMFTAKGHLTGANISDVIADDQGNNVTSKIEQRKDSAQMMRSKVTDDNQEVTERNAQNTFSDDERNNAVRKLDSRKSRKVPSKTMINRNETRFAKKSANSKKHITPEKQVSGKAFDPVGKVKNKSSTSSRNLSSVDYSNSAAKRRLGMGFTRRTSPNGLKPKHKGRSVWSLWSTCNEDCGLGQQERVRSCGHHCQEIESKPCLLESCEGAKVNDNWAYLDMFGHIDTDIKSASGDPCETWMKCSNKSIQHYLTNIANLPTCPCFYPLGIATDNKIFDRQHQQYFSWEDASGSIERNDVYKPGSKFCLRSRLPKNSVTLAAQHCCYDDQLRLITRGRDAGTPNLVSPQLSRELHKKVDILPWVLCKGDWTRYNIILPPNNHRQCEENPCLSEIHHQIALAKSY